MAFALSAAAVFAAPTKGTIKVTDTKKDQTYTLYKLFDATITFNDDDTQRAIAYTVPEGKTLAEDNAWFTVNAEGTVEAKEGVSDDWAKDSEAIAWAKSFGTQVGEAKTADSDGAEVKWEDLDWGYYFVDSTLGAFISVTSDNPDGEVKDKNELPTIAKVITAVSAGSNTDDAAIAEMGATVTFKVTVGAKAGAENYVVTDTLPAGITAPAAADVTVEGADVKVEGQVITVTFKKDYLDAIKEAKDIEITYTGVVNGDAVIGAEGNKNSAVLAWGHSDNNKTEPVVVTVYTAQVEITKVDNEGNALEGAGFVIEKGCTDGGIA